MNTKQANYFAKSYICGLGRCFLAMLLAYAPLSAQTEQSEDQHKPTVIKCSTPKIASPINPLLFLDDVAVPSGLLYFLDPKDIESFQIIKGASAFALYGTEGGKHGVISIKSKATKDKTIKKRIARLLKSWERYEEQRQQHKHSIPTYEDVEPIRSFLNGYYFRPEDSKELIPSPTKPAKPDSLNAKAYKSTK